MLVARDHQDLGSCLCYLDDIGSANYFHSKNQDPDESRRCIDDPTQPTFLGITTILEATATIK